MKTIQKLAINGEIYPVGGGGGGSALEVCDGEERVIGTWFGKPWYKKVITAPGPVSVNSNSLFYSPPEEFETVISLDGTLVRKDGYTVPINTGFSWAGYNRSKKQVETWTNSSSYIGGTVTLVLEYTKTTDLSPSAAVNEQDEIDSDLFSYDTGPDIPAVAATAPVIIEEV